MALIPAPGLPRGKVGLCALAEGQPGIARALEDRGVQVFLLPPAPFLQEPVAGHADMLLHPLGENRLLVAKGMRLPAEGLAEWGISVWEGERTLQGRYPADVALNCLPVGRNLFGRLDAAEPALLAWYQARGYRLWQTRQGYARCSACVVDDNSVITADPSLACAMGKAGINCLVIEPGHVCLPGYSYGFLGGCCGMTAHGVLAFTGDIAAHPSWKEIRAFCRQRGVEPDCLTPELLLDVGGIMPLLEVGLGQAGGGYGGSQPFSTA